MFGDDVTHVAVERLGRDVHAGARENGLDLVGDRARFGKAVGLFVLSALLNVDQREGRALFEEVDMLREEALDAKRLVGLIKADRDALQGTRKSACVRG